MITNMSIVFGVIVSFLGFLAVWVIYYFWKLQNRPDLDHNPLALTKAPQRGGKESREHPRANVNWPASMEAPEGTVTVQIKNISVGGAFVCYQNPLPIGEAFSLTMMVPDSQPLKATAKVVWSNVNVPESKVVNRGMGVRFINISEEHLQLVRQVCQESE